jgi:hypothetical protein
VYFLADLTPPPVSADPTTMVLSSEARDNFVKGFPATAGKIDYIVTTDADIPEVAAFVAMHAGATSVKRTLGGQEYLIIGLFPATAAP